MEEKKDGLQVELEKVEQEEREERRKLEDTPLARILKKKARVREQIRDKKIRNARKELEKANKKTQKASKAVEKHITKRVEAQSAAERWQREALKLSSAVKLLVEKERIIRVELEKLEGEGESKGMTMTESYEQSVKNLRQPVENVVYGNIKVEIGEEGEGNKIIPNRTVQAGDKR